MVTAYLIIFILAFSLLVMPSLPFSEWMIFTSLFTVYVFTMRYLYTLRNIRVSTSVGFLLALATAYLVNRFTSLEVPYFFILFVGATNLVYLGIFRHVKKER
ncbi:hypothetical protein CN378_17265 [Bacillus sp. AFS015802]|uniref:hypothetical protein n=1 Tax=Bacillus sp. AFS015802 TaxID=2033486 RepID=UPI000BF2C0E2|nr:hypothetical protein [Bacillus sp. AFS015802]PFA62794.1 hypothetical protein CN378_17265 [Bacillus sp. AFS015802]